MRVGLMVPCYIDMFYPQVGTLSSRRSSDRARFLNRATLTMMVCPSGRGPRCLRCTPQGPHVEVVLGRPGSNPKHLYDGDVVEVSVATDDAVIDLGTQSTVVRSS